MHCSSSGSAKFHNVKNIGVESCQGIGRFLDFYGKLFKGPFKKAKNLKKI